MGTRKITFQRLEKLCKLLVDSVLIDWCLYLIESDKWSGDAHERNSLDSEKFDFLFPTIVFSTYCISRSFKRKRHLFSYSNFLCSFPDFKFISARARGAPLLKKYGNPLMREILVL